MNHVRLKWSLEGIWWVFTLVVVVATLLPVALDTHDYPFYLPNLGYIVIAITFTRYTFLLRHTLIARMFWIKLLILGFSAILVFVLVLSLQDFSTYLSTEGLQTLVDHLPVKRQYRLMHYIQGEMIFWGIASIGSAIILALRMLISIWRMYNDGTV